MEEEPAAAEYRDPAPFRVDAQGHGLTFYPAGQDRLKALLELIAGATHSLRLAFYIFSPDDAGLVVRDALCEAVRRGVDVSLVLDGFGAEADAHFFAPLTEVGGRYACFIGHFGVRYLIRNHQKIVIADDRLAMLGGFNVEHSYFAPPQENGWHDLGFTVAGPVVARISDWFAELEEWAANPKAQFRSIRRKVREWDPGCGPVQLLIGGPTRGLSSWARKISTDLLYGKRLDMMMAYFSPSPRLRKRIAHVARRGDTRLVMAGKTDNGATIGASRLLYRGLLKAGARIYEFMPSKLHTKLIVLDDAVYMGSANFDMRSLYVNLEIMLCIEDAALAERMRQFIGDHLPASREITSESHRKQATLWNRFRWSISWFLVSVVDYTVTRRLNLGL
jgi:cardiolipin synthase